MEAFGKIVIFEVPDQNNGILDKIVELLKLDLNMQPVKLDAGTVLTFRDLEIDVARHMVTYM